MNTRNVPLYIQIQEELKERIINEVYEKEALIPSETELKNEFGVSMITIRRAVEELALQGYVEKKSGVGTKVIGNEAISKLSKGQRFSEYLNAEGFEVKRQFIQKETLSTAGQPALEAFGETCYCIERLYYLDDQPFIHFRHYLPVDLPMPSEEVFDSSLYRWMYQVGVDFDHFKDEFAVGYADEAVEKLLEVSPGTPLLERCRSTFNHQNKLVEYSVAFYCSDKQKYVMNFTM